MKEYNKDKIFDIMETTQCNYSNMMKRLLRKKKFSEFVLVFYSISLIVYPLTSEFFSCSFDAKLSNYFGIILSIVTLAYSLINGSAKYAERIDGAEKVLNSVKTLKRNLTDDNLEKIKADYEKLMEKAEYRDDVDFFRTVKQKCNELGIKWCKYKSDIKDKESKCNQKTENNGEYKKLNNYLSEISPFIQQCKIIFEFVWYALVFAIPIALFFVCFFI